MQRYIPQEVSCEQCNGTGYKLVSWEEYVFYHLPDRLNEGLTTMNDAQVKRGQKKLTWDDVATRANMPPGTLNEIRQGSYHARIHELYALADALEVKLTDLLPIGS